MPRLVLVCAPAGFGKTTLMAQWLAPNEPGETAAPPPSQRVAWLSLDAEDDIPRRFLTHLVAALQVVDPHVGAEASALMEADRGLAAEAVLVSLINDLDELPGQVVLVLDDYHVIEEPAVHESVTFLLAHLPARVTVAITTRADPPLPLARLRGRGELLELRAVDLRFTRDEAGEFLNAVMALGLSPAQVAALERRTEGWAAGLQLAALSVRGRSHAGAAGSDRVGDFVDAFTGSHRFVLDYLVEEVLAGLSDEVRRFLLDTSVLRQMTGALCDAVTGRDDGCQMLEALEDGNLFVVPLDDRRQWYRYHHLFADALRARLEAGHPERVTELHDSAGRWHVEHGSLPGAIAHARAGGDAERMADLVELALPELSRQRRDETLREYVRGIPDEVLRRRALLATAMAWSHLADGDLDGVEAWLDDAERAARTTRDVSGELRTSLAAEAEARDRELRRLPAMIAVYRASVAQARGDVEGTVAHARHALELTEPVDHFPRAAAAGFIGLAEWATGDLTTAVETFSEAVVSLRAAGNVADQLGATVPLADMWLGLGRPDEARRLYEQAVAAADRQPAPLSTTGDVHVGLADILREQGELEAAAMHLAVAREFGDAASLPENRHRLYTGQGRILRAHGDLDGALEMLERAETIYQPGFFPDVCPLPAAKARVQIARGHLAAASDWVRTTGVTVRDAPSYLGEFGQLTLARMLIARYRAGAERSLDGVVVMLDRIVEAAGAAGRTGSVIESRMVRALARVASGDTGAAVDDLSTALTDGVPAGYRQLFLDEGTPMEELLRSVGRQRRGSEAAEFADRVLALAGQRSRSQPEPSVTAAKDRLSERELEVLRLLASDLTGPEIARRLHVSVNTLRTHTKRIFTKLGVNTRRAAVSRAADLNLL